MAIDDDYEGEEEDDVEDFSSEVDQDEEQMPFDGSVPHFQDKYLNKTSEFKQEALDYLNSDECPFMLQTVIALKIYIKQWLSRDTLMSNGDPRKVAYMGTTIDPILLASDSAELELLKLSASCAAVDWGSAPMEDLLGKIAANLGFHLSRTHGKDKETILNRKATMSKELTQTTGSSTPQKTKSKGIFGGMFG